MVQKCNKVQPKHGKVTQNMHGASRNYRYVWDVSPGQRLLAAPILKRRRRRYREEIGKKTSILGVSSARAIYRRRGASGGHPGQPGECPARPPRGHARDPSGSLVVAPVFSLGLSGVFRRADFLYIFYGIFWAL